ncbi:hypothetical protein [Polaribacter sp. Hel1_85]|uniref:hypothetical protein n=1 Tax=Polaribacter sp. Hel1_85 TaxID=1250005 RepID=UPI00052BAE80|nr:hypothetical protein [Polaribacter sp. Hel1_85]KGL58379.1 hypothetical protein PHEL85_3437 [Polaribacter sp. Hel1_85]
MNLENLKSIIIGKWKYQDGRMLEFVTSEDFIYTDQNGITHPEKQKILLSEQKDGTLQLSIPILFEALGIIKSVSNNEIIYDSFELDGNKTTKKLFRI